MTINYELSPNPGMLEDWEVRICEAANDGAVVWSQVVPAPHNVPAVVVANGLDKVPHVVRLFSIPSGALLHWYNDIPSEPVVTLFSPIQFKIGDGGAETPPPGVTSFSLSGLVGLSSGDILVTRNGYGTLIEGVHYSFVSGNGTIGLLIANDEMGNEEEWTIQRKPNVIAVPVNDPVVGKWFGGYFDIVANTVYNHSMLRKLFRFSSENKTFIFPNIPIPVGYAFSFTFFGAQPASGALGSCTIQFNNAPIRGLGGGTGAFMLLFWLEQVTLVFDGTFWNVVYLSKVQNNFMPRVLGVGSFIVGDVAGGAGGNYTVQHFFNIQADYSVMLSVQAANPAALPNAATLTAAWAHHATEKKDKFVLQLRETVGVAQNVEIRYLLLGSY